MAKSEKMHHNLTKKEVLEIIDLYLHSYMYKEIAERLGISESVVGNYCLGYKLLNRGITKFRQRVRKENMDAVSEKYGLPYMEEYEKPVEEEPERVEQQVILIPEDAGTGGDRIDRLIEQGNEIIRLLTELVELWKK